jgi:hypothetical protein
LAMCGGSMNCRIMKQIYGKNKKANPWGWLFEDFND